MNELKIPPKDYRTKVLALRITQEEYDAIHEFCKRNKVKKSDLVRYAFKKSQLIIL